MTQAAVPYIKVAIMVASLATTVAIAASSKTTTTGPRLGDLSVSAATYGLPIPRGWGVCRLGGNMIWTGGIIESKRNVRSGKGGMGGKASATTFSYKASFAFAFAKGPCTRILRIWADSKIVYDETSPSNVVVPGLVMRQYYGTEDQMPDPAIVAKEGVGQVPAYRGLVYLVAEDVPLEPFGNRIPNISAEVAFQGHGTTMWEAMQNPIPYDDFPPEFHPPGTNIFNTFGVQPGFDAIDYTRQQWYMAVSGFGSTTDKHGGVVTASLDPLQIIRVTPTAEMYSGSGFDLPDIFLHDLYARHLVSGDGTDLFIEMSDPGTNRAYFVRVNPESMKVTGQFGSNVDHVDTHDPPINTADAIVDAQAVCINYSYSMTGQLQPFIAYTNQWNGPQIFNGLSMLHEWGSKLATIGGADLFPAYLTPRLAPSNVLGISYGNFATIPGRRNEDGTCEFWYMQFGWKLADGTDIDPCIDVWRIQVPGLAEYELAFTIPVRPILGTGVTSFYMGRAEYDRAADNIIMILGSSSFFDETDIISVNRAGVLNWHTTGISYVSFGPNDGGHSSLLGNTFAWMNGRPYVIDTTTGHVIDTEPLAFGDVGEQFASYNSSQMTIYQWGNTLQPGAFHGLLTGPPDKVIVNRGGGDPEKLSTIVSDLCLEAGLTADEFDVTALTDDVSGYSRVQEQARNLLADLCMVYFWDYVETDYKLKAKKRGGSPIATIPYANLIPQGSNPAALQVERNQAESLPRRFWVRYSDITNDQQQGTQHWARAQAPTNASIVNSAGEITLDLRLVMNPDQAKTLAKKRLMMLWGEREQFQNFGLPPAYLAFDPADVIILQGRDGFAYRTRIDKISIGADYSLQLNAAIEDPNLLNVIATGFGGSGITPTIIPAPFTPINVQPEMPLLRDGDDTAGLSLREYGAIGAYRGQSFGGATAYVSPDASTWTPMYSSTTSMVWGVAVNALPPPTFLYATDNTNFLDVTMTFGGELLESATSAEVLEGANVAALINTSGQVEIIQFTTVTPRGLSTYRLSGLQRGRKGSEWAVDTHVSGDRFILLEPTACRIATVPLGYLNTTRYEKVVGVNDVFDAVMPVPRIFTGTAEKPYAVAWITSSRDDLTNDLTISWFNRTRIGGDWLDIPSEGVPLGEAHEAYDVDILATDASVIRTLTTTSPSVVYTDANQTTDGMDTSPVSVAVYQKSDIIGRGYPAYATLPSPTGDIGAPTVTLTGITLDDLTTTAGVSPPEVVGHIVVSTTGGPFTGTLSLAGPDASKFSLAGSTLRTAVILAAGSYHVNLVATMPGATGSPFANFVTIVASASTVTISSITPSATSFVSGIDDLTVATIVVAMSSGTFVGSLALSGTDASSFDLTGTTLTTHGTLAPRTYAITLTATQTGISNSPFVRNFTMTATTTLTNLTLSSSTVASSAPTGTVVGVIAVISTGSFVGTLSITGTDAAKFAISGSNLVTATSLAAGVYSISLRATQTGATGSPLTRAFTISAVAGGSLTAPAQAVSAGYTTLQFEDDFTDATTIADTQDATTGFNWYWAQRLGDPADPSEWTVLETTHANEISNGNSGGGSNPSPDGGILQINTGGFPNANLISLPGWALNSGALSTLPALNSGRWQHCYIETYCQFKPDQNASVPYASTGWPAIWTWAAEGIGDYGFPGSGLTTANTTELDILESFGHAIWTDGGSGPANADVSTIINHQTGTDTAFTTVSPIDSNWHTIGMLWTPGNVSIYYDNVFKGSLSLSPDFSALDSQSLFLTLGTGPSWQLNIDWVRVWTV